MLYFSTIPGREHLFFVQVYGGIAVVSENRAVKKQLEKVIEFTVSTVNYSPFLKKAIICIRKCGDIVKICLVYFLEIVQNGYKSLTRERTNDMLISASDPGINFRK